MIQMSWTERKFNFDFPIEVFPGIVERLRGTPARVHELVRALPHNMLTRRVNDRWRARAGPCPAAQHADPSRE
jgi:hypothetical protein